MEIVFRALRQKDIPELIPIMKRAFDEDSQIHLGEPGGGPEGYDDGSFLRAVKENKNTVSCRICIDGKTAGAVFLWIDPETNENYLGNLFLDVCYQNKGIGQMLWEAIEERFPDTAVWRTEAPGFSRRSHYFLVAKCGFQVVRIDAPRDYVGCGYYFEKRLNTEPKQEEQGVDRQEETEEAILVC